MDRDGRYCSRCLTGHRFKLFFGALAGVQVAAAAILLMQSHTPSRPAIVSDPTPPSVVPSLAGMTAREGWQYYDVTDPLINDVTHHARLIAASAMNASGAARGVLELAVSPHYGTSIVVTFPPVRKSCSAAPCEVRAMFDRKAPVKIPFQDLSNDHASVLMLGDKDGFMSKLPAAHDLTIMASFGGAPDTVMTFNVAGLRMTLAALQARVRLASNSGGAIPPG